jgi:hypothetical protein
VVLAAEGNMKPPSNAEDPRISIASIGVSFTANYGSVAERLSKIRNEIVRVLEADGEPKQAFGRP